MRRNLAQKTYDVFVSEDGRWLIDSHHEVRSDAMARAEELLGEKRFLGVRVVAESERTGEEEVLFEELADVGDKPLKIVPIEEAPVCASIGDYYQFPARQTAGRILRELLDQKGQTALELAFDYGALKMLERNDNLFPPTMQRIGTIQAKKSGDKPSTHTDTLYAAFEQIKENARTLGEDPARLAYIEQRNLTGLAAAAAKGDPYQARVFVLAGLTQGLRQCGDWSDKIKLVMELAASASDDLVTGYLDEIAAEIFDSSMAVTDMFGGFGDMFKAFQALSQVTRGRCKIVNSRSCIAEFNDFMGHRPMPLTASVLLGRVARSLGGIRPMTREGPVAEREAFKTLLRELIADAGLLGGASMAAAVTRRARTVFGEPDDLPFDEALGKVLALLPNRAVRLGFLLDVIASPEGERNEQAVLNVLSRLVQQLQSLSSLIPDGTSQQDAERILDDLKSKMTGDALPEKWRQLFSKTLDRLVQRGEVAADKPGMIYKMVDAPVTTTKAIIRREASVGEVLFEEGDKANEAYLVLEGKIEIYRQKGNEQVVLATLGRGDILGEMSLIDNQPRMASARALEGTKLTVITRDDLAERLAKLGDNDKVLRRLIDVFVDRLRGQARVQE